MNARVAIALAFFAAVACKRHQEAAPSSTTTAPLSSSGVAVDPLGGVPSSVASVAVDADASMESHASDAGAPDDPARRAALREAQEFGMLGLINGGDGGAIGNIFGGDLGLDGGSFGVGGLGLTGSGGGIGIGHGRLGHLSAARLSLGALTVNGRLPPEVIRRIVRQNFGRFRLCYQDGLRSNPSLQGRVTTRFVIGSDGSVSTAKDNGSDMPDQNVVQCVVRAFSNISYPQPEGGIVVVSAPIMFSPGT